MNLRMRGGKSSELIVAGQLIRRGLDVYMPCVDDQAIDLVIRVDRGDEVVFHEIQVKSVKGYNRIVGVSVPHEKRRSRYVLVIHYRHDAGHDEFFYLRGDQITKHRPEGATWGDLIFNKAERAMYAHQTLDDLARCLQQEQG